MKDIEKNKQANERWITNRPKHERSVKQKAWVMEYKKRYASIHEIRKRPYETQDLNEL